MFEELRAQNQNVPRAQAVSISLHVGFLGLLLIPLWTASLQFHFPVPAIWLRPPGPLTAPPPEYFAQIGQRTGGSGAQESKPVGRGSFLTSALPLAPVIHPTNLEAFSVPPSVEGVPAIHDGGPNWGIPWSNQPPGSLGTGCCNGPGDGEGPGAGNKVGRGTSPFDVSGPPGSSLPICAYCPNPTFTAEAIKAKYQGSVLLRVLINAEGRVEGIQLRKGVGMGLEERAIEAVRTWRFRPSRAPSGQAVPAVVFIEVQFRQF